MDTILHHLTPSLENTMNKKNEFSHLTEDGHTYTRNSFKAYTHVGLQFREEKVWDAETREWVSRGTHWQVVGWSASAAGALALARASIRYAPAGTLAKTEPINNGNR